MYPRTSELFEFNKMLVIYLITGFIVSLWVARMLLTKKLVFRMNILVWPLLAFLLSQILSTIFSIDPHTSLFGYYGRFNGGLISIFAYVLLCFGFITHASLHSRDEVRHQIEGLLKVSILSSLIVMAWGLPSHFGYDPSCFAFSGNFDVSCWTEQFKPTIRVFSTLGQPNWLAAYLVIHICIGTYFFMKQHMPNGRIFYGAYMSLAMVMLLYTRSRSGLLALGIAGAVIGLHILHQKAYYFKKEALKKIGMIFLALLIPILIVGIHIPNSRPETVAEAPTVSKTQAPTKITDSSAIRKIVWQGAFSLGLEYPFFGTGVETFAYSYNFFRPLDHNATSEWDYVYNKAHNEIFNYFATTGFTGLITYLLFFVVVLMQLRVVYRGDLQRSESLLVVTLLAAFISIFVTNFFGFSTSTANLFYYLIPAWIVAICYRPSLVKYRDDFEISENDALKLVIPACIAIFSMWYVVSYFRADTAYAYGEGLESQQDYEHSLPYLHTAYGIRPEHVYADKISQTYARSAGNTCADIDGVSRDCIALAQAYNDKALHGSPQNAMYYRTQARNNFLFFQATQQEKYFKKAVQAVDKARELSPTDPRLPYLRALFALGLFETKKTATDKDRDLLRLSGLSSIQFAIELKEDYTNAYYLKGLIQKTLKDTDGARQTFNYILDTLEPGNEQAKQELKNL